MEGRNARTSPNDVVSVVIPVFNRATRVGAAIESVLSQAVPSGWSVEIIVVDDGSTDQTPEVVASWCNRDGRISMHRISHSGYPGLVRNRGVGRSTGRVLAFLDSDDRWLPGKLAAQLRLHDEGAVKWSHTRERWLRRNIEISQARHRHRRLGDVFFASLHKCIVGPSTVMMDRDFFIWMGGFRDDLEIAEDYEFWLRTAAVEPVGYLDTPFIEKHGGRRDQLSAKYDHIEGFRICALQDLLKANWFVRNAGIAAPGLARGLSGCSQARPPRAGTRSALCRFTARRELARKLRIYSAGALKRGRVGESRRLEESALGMEPAITGRF